MADRLSNRVAKATEKAAADSSAPEPPQNLDAEESVLGACLLSGAAIDVVAEELDAGDFYRASHSKIYLAIAAIHGAGSPVDAITVADRLDEQGVLAEIGGKERIHELAALVPATLNARHYARIVREMATLRGLTTVGEQITRLGWDRPKPAAELVDEAEKLIFDLARTGRRSDFAEAADVVDETIRHLEELAASGAAVVGLPTGYREIDRMTSGLRPGSMVVVAGRPSMGKTAFALGIVANTILREKKPVVVFTFEMTKLEIMQRLLSVEGLVDGTHVQTPSRLSKDDWSKVMAAANRIAASSLFIEDTKTLTMLDVRSKARQLKLRRPDLALVVVDYIQLMKSGSSRWESNQLDVAATSRELKLMAGELDVPVVALSQLSRAVEGRHDSRPNLSDLRDSGAIEQDADVVLMLYRGSYYLPEEPELQGIAEVDVAKQRNGPTGMRKLSFVDRYARFGDLAAETPFSTVET